MGETKADANADVESGIDAARKRLQAAAQRAQDRAKDFVSTATTAANKFVGPVQERLASAIGEDAAANVSHLRDRAEGAICKARTNAMAVADKIQAQTKTAVETIQADPRVVEALENPRVAAALTKVTSVAKSVRQTIEPYVRRNIS